MANVLDDKLHPRIVAGPRNGRQLVCEYLPLAGVVRIPHRPPYVAQKIGVADDDRLQETVCELLAAADQDGGSNPISEVAAAFYVAMRHSEDHDATQEDVAYAVGLSKPTIRSNYRKYADET